MDSCKYTYEEANAYIADVSRFAKKNGLDNTYELLGRLGHPEESFRVIHVAGTNGKGSVCAFLAGIAQEAGFRTGLFTSPHLVRINERFQINRLEVDDDTFTAAFCRVMEAINEMKMDGFPHPTYFEILFAVGMVIFRDAGIDVLVMETGLGGRLDATNTVARPIMCVITSISLDHTQYLGDTVEKIAAEKAGIIKTGVPVVYDGSDRRAEKVILEKAAAMQAPAVPVYPQMARITGRDDKGIAFVLNNKYYDYVPVRVPFIADYQVMNCSIAMTAFRYASGKGLLGEKGRLTGNAGIRRAVSEVRWSGRMEMVLPGVVIDGAHNEDGVARFVETVGKISATNQVSLLFAAVSDKNYEKMIREICEGAAFSSVVVTQVDDRRRMDADVLAELFRRFTKAPVYVKKNVPEAFSLALELKQEGILFCCGSLYLAGEILGLLRSRQNQRTEE